MLYSGPSHDLQCQVRRWWVRWRMRMAAGCFSVAMGGSMAAEKPPLLLVQPMDRVMPPNAVVLHFARWLPHYLGEKVVLHRESNGKGLEGIEWAARSAPPENTLLFLSLLWLARLDSLPASVSDTRNWVPLQVVLQGTWCLTAAEDRNLPNYEALHAWLRTLHRPVRLGVSHSFGLPDLWMRAMARKTSLPWKTVPFGLLSQATQALAVGQVDLVLDLCAETAAYLSADADRMPANRLGVQVLAHEGLPPTVKAPTFTQWRLPPIVPSWMAWFASPEMSASRREKLSQALHTVLLREDTQALLVALYQQPMRMSTADSLRFVRRTQAEGLSLQQWLERAVDPVLEMGGRVP